MDLIDKEIQEVLDSPSGRFTSSKPHFFKTKKAVILLVGILLFTAAGVYKFVFMNVPAKNSASETLSPIPKAEDLQPGTIKKERELSNQLSYHIDEVSMGGVALSPETKIGIEKALTAVINDEVETISPPPVVSVSPSPRDSLDRPQEKKGIAISDIEIQSAQLFQIGKRIPEGGEVVAAASYGFSVVLGGAQSGDLEEYIGLTVDKEIDGIILPATYISAHTTGKIGSSVFQDIIDISDSRFRNAEKVKFIIYSKDHPHLRKEMTYLVKRRFSSPGKGALGIQVASQTSGGDALDRVLVAGATVNVYALNSNIPIYSSRTKAGGFTRIFDIEPGDYAVAAEYKGAISTRDTVKIIPEERVQDMSQRRFLTIPLKPSEIAIPTGKLLGRITYHMHPTLHGLGAAGIPVSAFKVEEWGEARGGVLVSTTFTDEDGLYAFELPGDQYYYLTYPAPQGWDYVYPLDLTLPVQPLFADSETNDQWTQIIPKE